VKKLKKMKGKFDKIDIYEGKVPKGWKK